MLIFKFLIVLIMFIGLLCTLAPRFHGTAIILLGAGIYSVIIGMSTFPLWVGTSLILLFLVAEIGANGLRMLLTRHSEVSRIYSVDTSVCNLAGVVVTDALLGPVLGTLSWELLVGKTLFPRLDSIGRVLVRLIVAATLRLFCGLIMIIIVVKYIM